jgi:hypothetical protein
MKFNKKKICTKELWSLSSLRCEATNLSFHISRYYITKYIAVTCALLSFGNKILYDVAQVFRIMKMYLRSADAYEQGMSNAFKRK